LHSTSRTGLLIEGRSRPRGFFACFGGHRQFFSAGGADLLVTHHDGAAGRAFLDRNFHYPDLRHFDIKMSTASGRNATDSVEDLRETPETDRSILTQTRGISTRKRGLGHDFGQASLGDYCFPVSPR